ncbi:hypothetical protein SIK60_15360, partial [Clostridioides difficile]|uniref:hypothetical protein n=1 Tax=Clostridioides difficile TaxID=1496 RepID=UPI0029C1B279
DILRKMPTVFRKSDFKVTITYVQKQKKLTIINIEQGNKENSLLQKRDKFKMIRRNIYGVYY